MGSEFTGIMKTFKLDNHCTEAMANQHLYGSGERNRIQMYVGKNKHLGMKQHQNN